MVYTRLLSNKMKNIKSRLYLQVRNQIAEDIDSGVLKPNDSLPSERALSERFDVSRMTARQALIQLEKEGLAYTDGKRSRFVAEPVVNYDLSKTVSLFASNSFGNNESHIYIIDSKTITANDEQRTRLSLSAGSKIHFYSRLCLVANKPAFIEEEYVSAKRFPGLLEHNIRQPVSRLFETHYGVRSVRDQMVIRQAQFSSSIAKSLELEEPALGLVLEQTVYDETDQAISFGCQYWRGDVARFSADISYEHDPL